MKFKNNNEDVCLKTNSIEEKGIVWYMDSGATKHMVNNKSFFCFDSRMKDNVRLADGRYAKIEGIGSGTIKCVQNGNNIRNIKVDVLYVPTLETNLLSVRKLNERGFKVLFEEH